jgi:hypothetical protein
MLNGDSFRIRERFYREEFKLRGEKFNRESKRDNKKFRVYGQGI